MEGLLIPLGFFASVVLVLYIYYTNRNKERMALIEKGADASLFKARPRTLPAFPTLKLGMFLVGIGVGILMGNIVETLTRLQPETAYFSMILLFGGASLIANFMIEKGKSNKPLQ
jgi:hypothetical protein